MCVTIAVKILLTIDSDITVDSYHKSKCKRLSTLMEVLIKFTILLQRIYLNQNKYSKLKNIIEVQVLVVLTVNPKI